MSKFFNTNTTVFNNYTNLLDLILGSMDSNEFHHWMPEMTSLLSFSNYMKDVSTEHARVVEDWKTWQPIITNLRAELRA